MGLPVGELAGSPLGFRLISSRYFARSLTAEEGGVYILAYARDLDEASQATILIYQERADGNLLAVAGEAAVDITLDDGAPATYIEGSWRVANGTVVWDGSSSQTLVFDRGGLRTVIQYVQGPPVTVEELKLIAQSLVPAARP